MRGNWNVDRSSRPSDLDPLNSSGRPWPFGTSTTVDWITSATVPDGTIATAVPPLFAAYATVLEPDDDDQVELGDHERAVVEHLSKHGSMQWWLGYLDTGIHDVVFPHAPRVPMYWDWPYVLVLAGPDQALDWRRTLPDLIFPLDRSWLFSMLWDDNWTSIGGPTTLIDALTADPPVDARTVGRHEDPHPAQ